MIATKFETVEVTGDLIKDYKGHCEAQFKAPVTKNKEKYKVGADKICRFSSGHKLRVHMSKNMSGIVEMAFLPLKPNMQPTFHTAPFYTAMVAVKKAKLDDVKGLFKYLGQTAIDHINTIPEKLGGDCHYEGEVNHE